MSGDRATYLRIVRGISVCPLLCKAPGGLVPVKRGLTLCPAPYQGAEPSAARDRESLFLAMPNFGPHPSLFPPHFASTLPRFLRTHLVNSPSSEWLDCYTGPLPPRRQQNRTGGSNKHNSLPEPLTGTRRIRTTPVRSLGHKPPAPTRTLKLRFDNGVTRRCIGCSVPRARGRAIETGVWGPAATGRLPAAARS